MIEELNNYYLNKEEPNKSCLIALRDIILKQDSNITATLKYGCLASVTRKKCFVIYGQIKKKTNLIY